MKTEFLVLFELKLEPCYYTFVVMEYLFTSARLGFRTWDKADLEPMTAINTDHAVMEFFPDVQNEVQTAGFITQMQTQWAERGYCYYAVDELTTGNLIGFIGLSYKAFEADFTPCVDIGWRLATAYWHKGYATEGAKRCIAYGTEVLGLTEIYAIAPAINTRSVAVMIKAGMHLYSNFAHPLLADHPHLQPCVAYKVMRKEHR